jgi:hypothetical protein
MRVIGSLVGGAPLSLYPTLMQLNNPSSIIRFTSGNMCGINEEEVNLYRGARPTFNPSLSKKKNQTKSQNEQV